MMMLSCKEITSLVSQSLDGDLPFRQRLGVRLHLWMCSLCARFRRQLLFLHEAARYLGRNAAASASGRLPQEARARIKQALREAGN